MEMRKAEGVVGRDFNKGTMGANYRADQGQRVRQSALKAPHLHASIGALVSTMPKFVIEREIPGAGSLSEAQLREVSRKSISVLRGMGPQIQWLHSYVTGDKVYCVYLAPDETSIHEHAKRVGIPANRVSAVRRLLDPTWAE